MKDRYLKQSDVITQYVAALQDQYGQLGIGHPDAASRLQQMLSVLPRVTEVRFKEDTTERLPFTAEGFRTRRKQLDKKMVEIAEESGVDYNALIRIEKGERVYSDSLLKLIKYYETKGL